MGGFFVTDLKDKRIKNMFKSWRLWQERFGAPSDVNVDSSSEQSEDSTWFSQYLDNIAKKYEEAVASVPGLKKNIELSQKIDAKNSKLLFDGRHLHWFSGGELIKKWPATSGHLQDEISTVGEEGDASSELAVRILGIIKQAEGKSIRKVTREIEKLSPQRIPFQYIIGFISSLWVVDKTKFKQTINQRRDKINSQIFMENFRKLLKYLKLSYASENIPAKGRRKRQSIKNAGPIPEGPYILRHKIQEAPLKADPSLYATLLIAIGAVNKARRGASRKWHSEEFKDLVKSVFPEDIYMQTANPSGGGSSDDDFGATNFDLQGNVTSANELTTISWGNYRVRISPKYNKKAVEAITNKQRKAELKKYGTSYYNRGGFFIHGGTLRGSSGCIDLSEVMEDFAQFWTLNEVTEIEKVSGSDGGKQWAAIKIPLEVKYTDEVRKEIAPNLRKFIIDD